MSADDHNQKPKTEAERARDPLMRRDELARREQDEILMAGEDGGKSISAGHVDGLVGRKSFGERKEERGNREKVRSDNWFLVNQLIDDRFVVLEEQKDANDELLNLVRAKEFDPENQEHINLLEDAGINDIQHFISLSDEQREKLLRENDVRIQVEKDRVLEMQRELEDNPDPTIEELQKMRETLEGREEFDMALGQTESRERQIEIIEATEGFNESGLTEALLDESSNTSYSDASDLMSFLDEEPVIDVAPVKNAFAEATGNEGEKAELEEVELTVSEAQDAGERLAAKANPSNNDFTI